MKMFLKSTSLALIACAFVSGSAFSQGSNPTGMLNDSMDDLASRAYTCVIVTSNHRFTEVVVAGNTANAQEAALNRLSLSKFSREGGKQVLAVNGLGGPSEIQTVLCQLGINR